MLTGLIPPTVPGAADKGRWMETARLTGTGPRAQLRQLCTVTQASPRHSTTSHLTPAPTTSAQRHEGTADQMACHSAGLGHGERGAATATDGLFSCCSPPALPCPSHLSIDELAEPGLGTPELAGAYFATVQCVLSVPHPEASAGIPIGIRRLNGHGHSARPEISNGTTGKPC